MSNEPGAAEGQMVNVAPSQQPVHPVENKNQPAPKGDPFYEMLNSALMQGSGARSKEHAQRINNALADFIKSVNDRYTENILNQSGKNAKDEEGKKQLADNFKKWFEDKSAGFESIPKNIDTIRDNLPASQYNRMALLINNLRHDSLLTLNGIQQGLNNEKGYDRYLNNYAFQWPSRVIERTIRQFREKPVIESFDPNETLGFLNGLFDVIAKDDPNFHLNFSIDPQIHTISADRLFFEGAVFNLVRNAQNILSQRKDQSADANINVTMQLENGQVVLKVQDNAGGFKTEPPEKNMLAEVPRKDENGNEVKDNEGNPVMIQRAFARGETSGTGGSGIGLDIVRQITEEHLGGKVRADNAAFPGTEEMGAVVEMRFPLG